MARLPSNHLESNEKEMSLWEQEIEKMSGRRAAVEK